MDGKHVLIKCSKNFGSCYFNYTSIFSIILLTLVDADYKISYVVVGCNDRVSDGEIIRNSFLGDALENGKLNVPNFEKDQFPYVVIAHKVLPLKTDIVKPYVLRNLAIEKNDLQLTFVSNPSNS